MSSKKDDYIKIVRRECETLKVDPALLCAIIDTESNWRPNAVRYEKNFRYLWLPAKYADQENITLETETILQRMSFGLTQIMGANLRWMDYEDPLMTSFDPEKNIIFGVKFFKNRCDKYDDIKDKISAYNAGSPIKNGDSYKNEGYVDKVYKAYKEFKIL